VEVLDDMPIRRLRQAAGAAIAAAAIMLALALPVLAQEGGHEPISPERKLLAVGILVAALVVMVAWAWLYRRVNRI
jgi:hypothetical protein